MTRGFATLVAVALMLPAGGSAAALRLCDGEPPELVNRDGQAHAYTLLCNRRQEQRTIAAGASEKLEGKSGCSLTLGDNPAEKLSTEMVCTIVGGKLTCDLL